MLMALLDLKLYLNYWGNYMFFLHFIPDSFIEFVIDLMLVVGGLGISLSWLPFTIRALIPYTTIISFFSTIVFMFGIFFKGGYSVEEEWKQKIKELEKEVEIAQAKSQVVNSQIETQIVEKVKTVKEKVYVTSTKIKENQVFIDNECIVPDVARLLYNSAVTGEISASATTIDASSTILIDSGQYSDQIK